MPPAADGTPGTAGAFSDAWLRERLDGSRRRLGTDVIDHYVHFFRTEQRKFDEAVTTWERERYFERG